MADVEAARRALEDALGPSEVLSDPLERALYGRDASLVEGTCALVAFPRSADDVIACMEIAVRHGLAIVPRGAGTGLAGGSVPIGDALVVTTTKMDRILEIRPDDRLAWVEPGVVTLDLVTELEPLGFTFAPDPSSRQVSTIGGNVATNAGGAHCLAYGVTTNHVLALDVVLSDGTLVRLGGEGPEAPGYDLRGVVVGSEGTLGVVVGVCVRLTPLPAAVRTLLLDFPTVEDCAATVSEIIARRVIPAALEMMDRRLVEAVEAAVAAGYPSDAAAVLLVELDGLPSAIDAQAAEVEAAARAHGVGTVRIAAAAEERDLLWKGRRSALGACGLIAPRTHLHDVVVPRARLVEAVSGVYTIGRRHDLVVSFMLHAGDGNLHPHLHFRPDEPGVFDRVLAASEELVRLAIEVGGTLSGEHGIGLEKRAFMPLVFGPADLEVQACVRAAFDPPGRMNPEKILPSDVACLERREEADRDVPASPGSPEAPWS